MADYIFQANLNCERLGRNLRTDAEGRATFVSLIPGATYRIHGREFIAEARKTLVSACPRHGSATVRPPAQSGCD